VEALEIDADEIVTTSAKAAEAMRESLPKSRLH